MESRSHVKGRWLGSLASLLPDSMSFHRTSFLTAITVWGSWRGSSSSLPHCGLRLLCPHYRLSSFWWFSLLDVSFLELCRQWHLASRRVTLSAKWVLYAPAFFMILLSLRTARSGFTSSASSTTDFLLQFLSQFSHQNFNICYMFHRKGENVLFFLSFSFLIASILLIIFFSSSQHPNPGLRPVP